MKAFLIPGNGEDLASRDYQAVLDTYKQAGYEPIFVPIHWHYKTVNDWIGQVTKEIPQRDLQKSLLSGFSFGSIIALGVAAQVNPCHLFLFSLSPYFKEDMPFPPKYEKWHGKRRLAAFKQLSFNKLTAEINCPTTIFLGAKEREKYENVKHRSQQAQKSIVGSKLIVVPGTAHDVGAPNYIKAIKQALRTVRNQ